jgi:hypothetical protein
MEMSGDSMIKVGLVKELRKITQEYWNNKTDMDTSSFNMKANVIELIADDTSSKAILSSMVTQPMNIGFRGGRFQLRR